MAVYMGTNDKYALMYVHVFMYVVYSSYVCRCTYMRNKYVPANGVTYRAGNVALSIKIRMFRPLRPSSTED